jgi:hypothetical protein
MPDKPIEQLAEEHWQYTKVLLLNMIEVMHYLYVEAMKHGYKHRDEELKQNKGAK